MTAVIIECVTNYDITTGLEYNVIPGDTYVVQAETSNFYQVLTDAGLELVPKLFFIVKNT